MRESKRRALAKLSFSADDDFLIVAALAHYPDSRHSALLAGWLRAGWRIATGSSADVRVAAPATRPGNAAPAQRVRALVRRVFVDAAIDPGLAQYLEGLPRQARGREIRRLIQRALDAAAQLQSPLRADARPGCGHARARRPDGSR